MVGWAENRIKIYTRTTLVVAAVVVVWLLQAPVRSAAARGGCLLFVPLGSPLSPSLSLFLLPCENPEIL
jgi:hypothetical protein